MLYLYCSVRHSLLDELKKNLAIKNVSYKYIDCSYPSSQGFIRWIFIFKEFLKIIKSAIFLNKKDILAFHYVSLQSLLSIFLLCFLNKNIVIHFWGSDFNAFSKIKPNFLLKFFIKKIRLVTFANSNAKDLFTKLYPESTTMLLTFGLSILDDIDKLTKKNKNDQYIKVVCGTNSSRNQQLLELIAIFDKDINKNNYQFIFPLTYGDFDYKESVRTALLSSSLNYKIVDVFMVGQELAQFRADADILIQVQIKDFLSAAMIEHLYAGSKVITGRWLPYNQLRDLDIDWIEVDELNELPEALKMIVKKDIDFVRNKKALYNFSRWESVVGKWTDVYFHE
jgi:hypothetical protein